MIHSKVKFLLQLGILAMLLAPLALQATPAGADGWVIECVDCPNQFWGMTDRSLRLDAAGHPHIAYGKDHLYYAWHDGVSWHYETVDDTPGVGQDASLALDGDGYPHISYYYYDYTNSALKYAHQDDSGWHIETVDSEGYVGSFTSLALDGDGHPHISYYYCGTSIYPCNVGDLKYAYQDDSGWHIKTVDSVGEWQWDGSSLALEASGLPHISYHDDTNGDLKYAYQDDQDASGWHIEIVDWEGYVGGWPSLALDESGYPHISYSGGGLKYAYQDASGWHIKTVDSGGSAGMHTSLALDGGGYPYISYYDGGSNRDLKYAYQDDSGWHINSNSR